MNGKQNNRKKFTSISEAAKHHDESLNKLDDLSSRISNIEARVDGLDERASNVKFVIKAGTWIMSGIIIVFFITILGFTYDAWRFHTNSYDEYRKTVNALQTELEDTKYRSIIDKVRNLEKKVDEPEKSKNLDKK